jgi:hypothetical protein
LIIIMASFGPRFSAASVTIAFRARVKRALGCKLPGEKAARRALRIISGHRGETADLLAEVDPRAGLHLMRPGVVLIAVAQVRVCRDRSLQSAISYWTN